MIEIAVPAASSVPSVITEPTKLVVFPTRLIVTCLRYLADADPSDLTPLTDTMASIWVSAKILNRISVPALFSPISVGVALVVLAPIGCSIAWEDPVTTPNCEAA